MRKYLILMLLGLPLILSACGGGGGHSDVTPPPGGNTQQSMSDMVEQILAMDENEEPLQPDADNMLYDISEDENQFSSLFPQ